MKKFLLAVVAMAALTTACVPAPYRMHPAPSPIGRWDNVIMLAAGTPVQVQLMHGPLERGQVVSADSAPSGSAPHRVSRILLRLT